MQTRHGQPFGLFGGFDGDGAQASFVHPVRIAAFGDDGEQCGDTEFGRLLHDQVGGIALQQRKDQPKVGFRRLGPQLLVHAEIGAVAPDHLDAGSEFAVASVEQVDHVAWASPHDGAEVVRLLRRGGDGFAGAERCGDMEAD